MAYLSACLLCHYSPYQKMNDKDKLTRLQTDIIKMIKDIRKKRELKMKNQVYDGAKWAITLGLPTLAVFIQTIGLNFVLWNTNGVEVNVVLLLNSIGALGAAWLGISSINYRKQG